MHKTTRSTSIFLLMLAMGLGGGANVEAQTAAQQDATLKRMAEQFFSNLVAKNDRELLQRFPMTDSIRSWIQEGRYRTREIIIEQYGGVGKLRGKEIIRQDAQTPIVWLFYSGETKSFRVRVLFNRNKIAGIHYLSWTDERAHGGTPIRLSAPVAECD